VFRSFREIVGSEIAAIAFSDADAEQAELLDDICHPDSRHEILVATTAGRIVGFVSFAIDAEKRMGEIGLNAVHPRRTGAGIGTELYRHVFVRMKERDGARHGRYGRRSQPRPCTARLRESRLRPRDRVRHAVSAALMAARKCHRASVARVRRCFRLAFRHKRRRRSL